MSAPKLAPVERLLRRARAPEPAPRETLRLGVEITSEGAPPEREFFIILRYDLVKLGENGIHRARRTHKAFRVSCSSRARA